MYSKQRKSGFPLSVHISDGTFEIQSWMFLWQTIKLLCISNYFVESL